MAALLACWLLPLSWTRLSSACSLQVSPMSRTFQSSHPALPFAPTLGWRLAKWQRT